MDIITYAKGSSIRIIATVVDIDFLPIDEADVTLTVTSPDNIILVNNEAMTTDVAGTYYYEFQTTSSFLIGLYAVTVNIRGTPFSAIYVTDHLFELADKSD